MNIFKINGKVVTPMLNGSILPGVTRATCIDLYWGMDVEERRISVDEWVVEAAKSGALEECWAHCGAISRWAPCGMRTPSWRSAAAASAR